TLVFGLYAALCLAMNLRWRRPALSYAGSILLLGCLRYVFSWQTPLPPEWCWLYALLTHATLVLGAGLGLRRCSADTTFAEPLRWSAFVSSLVAVIPLLFVL